MNHDQDDDMHTGMTGTGSANEEGQDHNNNNNNIDDEAEYLDSNDVIEVATLDDTTENVPMDDEDDDDDVDIEDIDADDADDDNHDDENTIRRGGTMQEPPSDELFMTITAHTGPVYTCAVLALEIDTTVETSTSTTTNSSTTTTNTTMVEQPQQPHAVPPTLSPSVEASSSTSSSASSLLIATGGGDDISVLTRAVLPHLDTTNYNNNNNRNRMETEDAPGDDPKTATAAVVVTQQQPLVYQHSDSVSAVAFGFVPTPLPPPTTTATTSTTGTTTTSTTTTTGQAPPNILLAVGGYDGMIVLYDGNTGTCLMNVSNIEEFKSNFAGPTDIEWLTFHKTGTVLLAGSSTDGTVWMYHVVVPAAAATTTSTATPPPKHSYYYTLNCMQVFVGHASMVSAGGFTSDGRWAVSIGNSGTRDDATLRVWNPKTGLAKHTIHLHSGSTTGVLMPTTNYNQTYNDDDNDDGSPYAGLTCLAFGIADEPTTGTSVMSTATTTTPTNTASTSSKLLLVGSEDGWAYVCHAGTGKVLHAFRHAAEPMYNHNIPMTDNDVPTAEVLLSIEAVGFCPSNPMWCATGGADGVLKIWDLNNGQCRHLCRYSSIDPALSTKHTAVVGGITRLCWLPSNTSTPSSSMVPHPPIVFVATTDGMVHIWDARNGGLLRTLQTGGSATILDLQVLCVNHNRIVVVTASEDHLVRLFQLNLIDLLQQQQHSKP